MDNEYTKFFFTGLVIWRELANAFWKLYFDFEVAAYIGLALRTLLLILKTSSSYWSSLAQQFYYLAISIPPRELPISYSLVVQKVCGTLQHQQSGKQAV